MTHMPSGNELLNPLKLLKKASVDKGMSIADLGCGTTGHFIFPASHLVGRDGVVYAVDILKSALSGVESRAKMENVANIKTIWANIEIYKSAKIKDGELDMACIVNNGAKTSILKEAARIVKKGGKILVVDWMKTAKSPFGPPPAKRPDVKEVKAAAKELGLALSEEFKAGPYHFGMIFTK